jgi:hypothetical protein
MADTRLIDPGLPLMFGTALAQAVFGSTLFAEAVLVSSRLGSLRLHRRRGSPADRVDGAGDSAALFEIAVFPRTYSYPKIAAYAVEFWLRLGTWRARIAKPVCDGRRRGSRVPVPPRSRTVSGVGAVLTIVQSANGSVKTSARETAMFTAIVAVLLLPYLVYVQAYGGLWVYFRTGIEFSQREALRQWHVWPRVFGDERPLESALVYMLYLLPLIAIGILLARGTRGDWPAVAGRIAPVAVVGLLVDFSFIRDPLNTRLADAIVPAVILGAWLLSRAFSASSRREFTVPLALAFTLLMGASVVTVGFTHEEIDRAGLLGRARDIPTRFAERTADLRARFTDYQLTPAARRLLPFFGYVDRCTSADDRLLVGGFMVELPFYAQRLFAAGQEYFGSYFGSDANRRFTFDRLQRQRVPFVIVPSDGQAEFDRGFPLVAGYVRARYAPLTDVRVDDEQTIHILVNRDMPAAGRDAETGWPCFRSHAAETQSHPSS